jgi:hypothetical protein
VHVLPDSLFGPWIVLGSLASLVMLVQFFHPWLVLRILIDGVLMWPVLIANWRPGQAALEPRGKPDIPFRERRCDTRVGTPGEGMGRGLLEQRNSLTASA